MSTELISPDLRNPPHLSMAFPAIPNRAHSVSYPPRPTPGVGPRWISEELLTPPDSDHNEDEAAPLRKRPPRHFAAFDFGFIPLTDTGGSQEAPRERCYEELDEEPQIHVPCVKLKDGRELRPLLKHRKRAASHHVSDSPPSSNASLDSGHSSPEPQSAQVHAHVHFDDTLVNVCVFDESAPAHDADPTHSPLDPPRVSPPQPQSPRIKTRQLHLPSTVIASPTDRAALGISSSENSPETPSSASPLSPGRNMQLTLALDSNLPSAASAPENGMLSTLGVGLSPARDALVGVIRVRNIAYEKRVCVVYSADDWRTRNEANARWTDAYKTESRGKLGIPPCPDGYDDFEFSIPLGDLGIRAEVGSAVRARYLYFATRYQVPGHGEWWDSRDGQNWIARFRAVSAGF